MREPEPGLATPLATPTGRGSTAAMRAKPSPATNAAARKEAWADLRVLYSELFDVPAVLLRQKPLAALVGGREVLMLVGSVLGSIVMLDQYNLMLRRLASTVYLRDMPLFRTQILLATVLSFGQETMKTSARHLFYTLNRKWRVELSRRLQSRYIRSRAYYHCQGAGSTVLDADQRITDDATAVSRALVANIYRAFTYSGHAVSAVGQLMLFVSPRYVFLAGGYLWLTDRVRERVLPAIAVGSLAGQTSRARGEYRSALLRLQENAETIVAIGGTGFEKRHILESWSRLEQKMSATFAQTRQDAVIAQVMVVLEPLFQSLLVELPFVLAAAGAAVGQSTTQGMAANAAAIAQMTFTKTLVVRMMSLSSGMLKMPRLMLACSGTTGRARS